ncbi:hypothetical protein PL373_13305 [Tenacibaculum maritimum]|nr:hypothetical protein [Tenacibaculum maritimum]MDB0600297.1 hypothetical protein [Tenacibaculum maritimum]MDB0602106.1 hypothetical protein [Tenacibaculum maritimum]MDB0610808.1 hypothetical protein [Tenacibaculum maritimum]
MAQLGYTWYPENWWTSDEFFEWEDYPLVRYAYREILDLLYSKNGTAKISKAIIKSRFRIELTEDKFELLKSVFDVSDDGYWTNQKVKKRISKAEASRENGKKGGRPKKTQKPNLITQQENPKNPPLERERESEDEIKSKREDELEKNDGDNFELIETLKTKYLNNEKLIKAVLSVKKNKFQNKDEISKRLEQFNNELKSKSIFQKPWNDYTSHFLNWHRKTAGQNNDANQQSRQRIPIG